MDLNCLTGSEKNRLLNLYTECYKGHNKAARLFNEGHTNSQITPQEVIQFWGSIDLEISKAGGYRHGLSEENLRKLHKKYEGNIEKMCEESGVRLTILVKRCRDYNLPYIPPRKPKISQEYKSKIYLGDKRIRFPNPASKFKMPRS